MGKQYGRFSHDGSQYVINTPNTPDTWFNYLFNQDYFMRISQTAQGHSQCLTPAPRVHSRDYRFFYLLDHKTGQYWSPNCRPSIVRPEKYECIHALGWSEIKSSFHDIEASILAFVPRQGAREVWRCTIKNQSASARELSLFSVFSFAAARIMGTICAYDMAAHILTCYAFPHHQLYEDKFKLEKRKNVIFMFANQEPASFDCSERRFFGGDDLAAPPAAVKKGACSNLRSEWDYPIGAFQHRFSIPAGREMTVDIVVGCADSLDEAVEIKKTVFKHMDQELLSVNRFWEEICSRVRVGTPDKNLDYFLNYWLKKQVVMQSLCHRTASHAPTRNELQDAMGYGMLYPDGAALTMRQILAEQEQSGFLRQWHVEDGSVDGAPVITTMKHKDAPVWLVICACALVQQKGALSWLDTEVTFMDGKNKATIYEHLVRAIDYAASDRGRHGLCLMGDGDWTDPLNGPGRLGRGESAWTTMALRYAVLQLLPLCRAKNDLHRASQMTELAEDLDRAVNEACWDGQWYLGGYDDEGIPFGTSADSEARIFLNTQTWAIMSGIARHDRLDKCLAAIDRLDTPCGPVLLWPALSQWHPRLGKISLKLAGTTENGSVYCHASLFKAYADCLAGRGTEAYETVKKTMPTNPDNPPERNLQAPLFVPNFYFGLQDSPNFGQSSQHPMTGTAPWILWVTVEYLLGTRATISGLVIDPCVPSDWTGFRVERVYKKALYRIMVEKPKGITKGVQEILVDGVPIDGTVLPYGEGKVFEVKVKMGYKESPVETTPVPMEERVY